MTGSHILNNQKLSNTTIQILLNKIFSLNIDENEKTVEEFGWEMEINRN